MKTEAEVVELLPQAAVRLKLSNGHSVIAHPGAAVKINFVRLRPGDRVEVELSPQDPGRGRVVRLV